ncbi:hypothetical protein ACFWWQ_03820, partial [Streptomyces sp. NPDC059080]
MTGTGTGIGRRGLLAASGGLALTGLLAACGSHTGRDGGGSGPGISQWYHQYGEPGAERAVRRYADAYKKAHVTVQWRPGDYDRQTAAALLTDSGPDVFEVNGPTLDQIRGGGCGAWGAPAGAGRRGRADAGGGAPPGGGGTDC